MRIASLKLRLAVSTLAVALASTVPALAESVVFKAALNGASEVPPNDSTGTGALGHQRQDARLDDHLFRHFR